MGITTSFILLSFVLSMTCGFLVIPQILRVCKALDLYDKPNERKVHTSKVPRLGGISFLPSMTIALIIALGVYFRMTGRDVIIISSWSCYFLIGVLLVYIVGVIDDIKELKPHTKFLFQIIAACMIPFSGLWINNLYGLFGIHEIPMWVGVPLTVFVIVFINNAINLIDGIDGLSSGLSLIAFGGFLIIFMSKGMMVYSMLIAGMMGILVSYMYFNIFGKAEKNRKIFMGDSGSLTLGYVLGFFLVETSMDMSGSYKYAGSMNPLVISLTLVMVPVFDVVRVILIRFAKHRPIFGADRNHIHHKMLYLGLTQHQTLMLILTLELIYVTINSWMVSYNIGTTLILAVDILIYVVFNLIASAVKRSRIRRGLEVDESKALEQEESKPETSERKCAEPETTTVA